jgi:HSP20 family protein
MLATRWVREPLAEINRLRNEMHRLLDHWPAPATLPFAPLVYPPLDLWEDENNLYVEAELPGLELNDLEIFVNGDNQLSLQGERKPPRLDQGAWHRQERGFGHFSRLVELPCVVNPETVEAAFKDGVLTVRLPKREEARPRRIEVKTN